MGIRTRVGWLRTRLALPLSWNSVLNKKYVLQDFESRNDEGHTKLRRIYEKSYAAYAKVHL
jgi:hypothetical protein